VHIGCIERVIVAVTDLDRACERWGRAGFAVATDRASIDGVGCAKLAAGAVEIDLCALNSGTAKGPLADAIARKAADGGGVIGWTWGGAADGALPASGAITLASLAGAPIAAAAAEPSFHGAFTARVEVESTKEARLAALRRHCGTNANTIEFLEHIVVMVEGLDEAIAACQAAGLPCRRIRDAGRGIRQAFFKLEDTVLEVVGPSPRAAGVWGLAFMCGDIARAVATARQNGFEATEPKGAVQGGLIARIVEPLDGVAVAFMEGPRQAR
jgi:hypothetical protein